MHSASLPLDSPQPPDLRPAPIVFVVDDDVSVRESLGLLIRSTGWCPEMFSSATAFLARPRVDVPSCLVLDLSLPDVDGLEVQRRVVDARNDLPIIFITGYGDVPTTVQAMRAGAVDFLTKPFNDTVMVSAIAGAIERSRAMRGYEAGMQEIRDRYASLSRRERQVMALVVSGRPNKQVAAELHISQVTVKAHRGQVMRKMKATSFAALVQLAGKLGRT